jgi:hypothetical protein
MMGDVHRLLRVRGKVEGFAGAPIANRHGQLSGSATPEERDGDAVVFAVCELGFHEASFAEPRPAGNAASMCRACGCPYPGARSGGKRRELLLKVRSLLARRRVVDVKMPPTHTDEGLRAAKEIREQHTERAQLGADGRCELRFECARGDERRNAAERSLLVGSTLEVFELVCSEKR